MTVKRLSAFEELKVELRVQELLPFLFGLQLDTETAWALAHNVATVFYGSVHSFSSPKELLSHHSLQEIGDAFEQILDLDHAHWEEEYTREVTDYSTP